MSRPDLIPALIKAAPPAVKNSQGLPGADHLHSQALDFTEHLKTNPAGQAPGKSHHSRDAKIKGKDEAALQDETSSDDATAADAPAPDGDAAPAPQADEAQTAPDETVNAAALIITQLTAQADTDAAKAAPATTPDGQQAQPQIQAAVTLQSPLLSLAAVPTEGVAPAATAAGQDSIAAPAAVPGAIPAQASTAPGGVPLPLPQATQPPDSQTADPQATDTQTAKAEQPEAAAQPAAQDFVPAAQPNDGKATSLIKQLQPENTNAAADETPSMPNAQTQGQAPAQAQGKPDALPEQSAEIAKANFAGKNDDPATKTNNGLHLGAQIVKAETAALNTPHQYGHQIVHPQPTVPPSPVLDVQQSMARAGVALARVPFEIAVSAHKGEKEFEIRLDPPELGRVDVSMSVDKNGKVATHLVVERSETLDQLRKDAPNLERALQNSGLKTDSSSLQFSLRDQSAQNFAGQNRDSVMRRGALLVDLNATTAFAQPSMASLGADRGAGVDLRN
jgi:flagellar hook-length control protein FliK